MKVYLLTLDGGRRVFYSEGRVTPDEAGDTAPRGACAAGSSGCPAVGVRPNRRREGGSDPDVDRAEAAAWNEAGPGAPEGVAGRLRRAWDWLHRRLAPDEAMLKHLNRASTIKLYHPASMALPEVQRLWREYLARRRRRHWFWLVVDPPGRPPDGAADGDPRPERHRLLVRVSGHLPLAHRARDSPCAGRSGADELPSDARPGARARALRAGVDREDVPGATGCGSSAPSSRGRPKSPRSRSRRPAGRARPRRAARRPCPRTGIPEDRPGVEPCVRLGEPRRRCDC